MARLLRQRSYSHGNTRRANGNGRTRSWGTCVCGPSDSIRTWAPSWMQGAVLGLRSHIALRALPPRRRSWENKVFEVVPQSSEPLDMKMSSVDSLLTSSPLFNAGAR
eukprot:1355548-Pyramimonas_sp.AAC.1